MRYLKALIPLTAAGLLAGVFAAAPGVQAPASDAQLATIKEYCSGCHNDKAKTAGVSFDGITAASVGQNPELFEKAVRKLRGRVMPPPNAKQPESKAVDSLVTWLESSLDKVPDQQHIPDQVVLHRLNRKEYENAIRDLLAVDINANEMLPQDDTAQGFDNIASALQVSPSFIEQYVIAAWKVSVTALGKPKRAPRAGVSVPLPAISSRTLRDCPSVLAEASSRTSIFRPTANTTSTSPTWPPTSGAMAWSTRIPLSSLWITKWSTRRRSVAKRT